MVKLWNDHSVNLRIGKPSDDTLDVFTKGGCETLEYPSRWEHFYFSVMDRFILPIAGKILRNDQRYYDFVDWMDTHIGRWEK